MLASCVCSNASADKDDPGKTGTKTLTRLTFSMFGQTHPHLVRSITSPQYVQVKSSNVWTSGSAQHESALLPGSEFIMAIPQKGVVKDTF